MTREQIGGLNKPFGHHIVEDVGEFFISMARNLFNNTGGLSIPTEHRPLVIYQGFRPASGQGEVPSN